MSAQTNKHRQPDKKPQKARSSWRRPNQTTRILENVEMLIALHETQENEGNGELARLVNELESWKKESHNLLEKTNALVTDVEKQTSHQLDVKANDIVQSVESQIAEQFGSLDRRLSEITKSISKSLDSGSKSDPKSKNQILEITEIVSQQGQELEARLELFADHFEEKTDRILESVTASGSVEGDFLDDSLLEKRLEEIDQRLSKITNLVESHLSSPEAGGSPSDVQFGEQLELRFENLSEHVNKITSALAGQQALLESGSATGSDSDSFVYRQFNEKIESIVASFDSRIDGLFGSLGSRISQVSESVARQESSLEVASIAESNEDTASHWHRQKAAMLSKYGIDPDYRPLMEIPNNSTKVAESKSEPEFEEATENLESLHDSIDNISAADAEAIEQLKGELTSKLREAEVEFSINRAKLSQLKAELEGKQVELERRAAALEEKFGGSRDSGKKSGFLDRLARHLSLKKKQPLGK